MTKDEAEKTFWMTIVSSVLFTVFGTYLLYKPNLTITMLSRGLTIITVLIGILGLYRYITRKEKSKKINIDIIYGVIALIIALIVHFNPYAISGFIPIALGGFMLASSILKIGYLKQVGKNEKKDFGVCIFIFIIMLILSAVLIFNPLKTVLNTNQAIGIIIIFYSILDIIICYLFKNNIY